MRNMILRKACLRLLAGTSTLVATEASALDILTGNKTIYQGNEISNLTWLSDAHLRFGTVGVEDTLQAPISVAPDKTGTLSVTATSTLHTTLAFTQKNATFNFGSAVDTGTIILETPNPGGFRDNLAVNVNGGTLVATTNFLISDAHLTVGAGSVFRLTDTQNAFSAYELLGAGSVEGSGGGLTLSSGNFFGTINNFNALRFSVGYDGATYNSTVLSGRLQNIGSLSIGSGAGIQIGDAATASDIAQISSLTVDGILDFGGQNGNLHHLQGGGLVGTPGSLTLVDASFNGTLQANHGMVFNGVNFIGGATQGNVTISGGSSIFASSGFSVSTGSTLEVDGTLTLNSATTTAIDTLQGGGTINLSPGGTMKFNAATNSSFSGQIHGAGSLSIEGPGTVTLTGFNSYTGGTTVTQGGTLIGNTDGLWGDIFNYSTVVFDQAVDGTFSGTMTGGGQLRKQGAGTLTFANSAPFLGTTTISTGALSTTSNSLGGNVVDNAQLIFDQNFNGTFAASISGTGSLQKLGTGKLILSGGNTYTGPTFVTEGTLSVNGMLSSDVLVQNGAKLGGNGTVGSFTAQAGSFITPGNSIGTLNVIGNASFADGSTYVVEANAAGASDRVNATGQAVIGASAAVYVTSESGIDTSAGFPQSQTYRIVTAAGGISGKFGSVTDNFAYLAPTLSYDANSVYLTLTREAFATGSNPPNANGVAGAIDQLGPGTIYNAVLFMNNADKPVGLRSLAGELHPSVQRALLDGTSYSQSALTERLANDSDQPFWASGVTGRTRYRATATTFGLLQDTNQILAGADVFDAGGWRAGVFGGYGNTRISLSDINATAKVDTFQAGVYGSYTDGGLGLRYGAISAVHQVSTARGISFSTLSESENASYLAFTQQVFGEASYRFSRDDGYIEPYISVAALYQDSQPFRETGGAAALDGQATSRFNQVIDAGLRFKQGLPLGDVEARLVGKLGWQHTFGRNAFGANASIGGSSPFTVSGLEASRDLGIVEAGIGFDLAKGVDVSLQYRGAFGKASSSSAFNARLSARF